MSFVASTSKASAATGRTGEARVEISGLVLLISVLVVLLGTATG